MSEEIQRGYTTFTHMHCPYVESSKKDEERFEDFLS